MVQKIGYIQILIKQCIFFKNGASLKVDPAFITLEKSHNSTFKDTLNFIASSPSLPQRLHNFTAYTNSHYLTFKNASAWQIIKFQPADKLFDSLAQYQWPLNMAVQLKGKGENFQRSGWPRWEVALKSLRLHWKTGCWSHDGPPTAMNAKSLNISDDVSWNWSQTKDNVIIIIIRPKSQYNNYNNQTKDTIIIIRPKTQYKNNTTI